jgi:predicted TIM-barrel fold metal-dependent hydrolase
MKTFKIFDAHTHAFPDKIAAPTIAHLAGLAKIPAHHDGTFGGLLSYEGAAGGFLLLPIATKPASARSVNMWAFEKTRESHGKTVLAFGSLHPASETVDADLDFIVGNGLKGVKLHPEYQEFFADEERVFPVYEKIFARGLPVCFHAGEDLGFPPPVRGAACRIARVADAFPQGKIIAAHMGGFRQFGEVLETLAGRPNVWMDTSFASERMKAEEIVTLVRAHGADKFFFGTDAPWADFSTTAGAVWRSGLREDELEKIFYTNAAEFFGSA